MNCPRCKSPLETVDLGAFDGEYAPVVIDRCPACKGVWYDRGELDASDESPWTDVEALEFETRLSGGRRALCPRCEVLLTTVSPKGAREIQIERCPDCFGFWLEEGELEAVQKLTGQLDSETLEGMSSIPTPDEERYRFLRALHFLGHARRDRR